MNRLAFLWSQGAWDFYACAVVLGAAIAFGLYVGRLEAALLAVIAWRVFWR